MDNESSEKQEVIHQKCVRAADIDAIHKKLDTLTTSMDRLCDILVAQAQQQLQIKHAEERITNNSLTDADHESRLRNLENKLNSFSWIPKAIYAIIGGFGALLLTGVVTNLWK